MLVALWQLVPVAIGVMASPVAVMALIGILLSRHARRNGVGYLVGWALCTAVLLATSMLVFTVADASGSYREAAWVPFVHIVIAVACILGAIWTFARARQVVARVAAARTPDEIAAATPQLPGIVRSVEHFTPGRSFLLGFGIFLTPMNISLVVAAGFEIVLATVDDRFVALIALGFIVAAAAPVAVPVLTVLIRGDGATPLIRRLRRWMLRRNGYLSAGILVLVGILQLIKALQGWLS